LVGRRGGGREGSLPSPDVGEAEVFELAVGLGDGVRVDAEGDRELPDRGEWGVWEESAEDERAPDLVYDLGVDGARIAGVDTDEHERYGVVYWYTSTLRRTCQAFFVLLGIVARRRGDD